MAHAAVTFARHDLHGVTTWQCRSLKTAFQFLAHIPKASAAHPDIRNQAYKTFNTFLQDATIHQQLTEEVDEFIQLLQAHAYTQITSNSTLGIFFFKQKTAYEITR